MESDRIRAVTDFSRDIAVDASAGTGKTATLIARVTNLFLADRELSPDRVLLLTFTEKAAAEMKSRLVEGWELLLSSCRSAGSVDEVRAKAASWNALVRIPDGPYAGIEDLLDRAASLADGVGRLSVTTFHSFCRRILLAFPAEAGVDPRFEVLPEGEASDAWDAGFRLFLRAEFGGREVDPSWEVALSRVSRQDAIWSMIRRLCLSQRDLLADGPLDFGSPADFLPYLRREYAAPVEWFRAFVGGIADRGHEMTPVLEGALRALEDAWEAVLRDDLPGACARAAEGAAAFGFRADRTRSRTSFPQPPGATLAETRDILKRFWKELDETPRGDAAARFLVERARSALAHYERAKGSGLDFMDLLLRADRLLTGSPETAARLAERFRHVFVDEFQDTDPLQARMLRAISPGEAAGRVPADAGDAAAGARSGGRLFLVGDPKQSIYGFRRADIQEYVRFRSDLLSGAGEGITLLRNFRSRPDLIASINGLFGHVLSGGEDFSPAYSPVVPHRGDGGTGHPVTLYALGEEVPEAGFLGGLIGKIVGTVPVGGRGAERERPASFRDIAVLYRADTGGEAVAGYRKALDAAGIPHVVPSRKGFYARQEVQDLRMVLSAVDAPADASARYAALKTVFFGLRDEEILTLHAEGEGAAPPRLRDALGILGRLSARAGRASLPALIAELYGETGVEFVAARLPEGDRIVQNLAKAAGMARAFEWRGGGSVKAFIAEIRRRTEEDRRENEFPSFDEGEDAVRLSTIHASKGLEFPVVVLANLSRGGVKPVEGLRVDRVRGLSAVIFPGFRTYSAYREVESEGRGLTFERWETEKQAAEEKRLLYVAATRARDRLYLIEGPEGRGSAMDDALRKGLGRAEEGGEAACAVTGLAGRRLVFPATLPDGSGASSPGEILRVPVAAPIASPATLKPAPPDLSFTAGWDPALPEPLPALPEPISLTAFHDRERGRLFGEKVHLALEAAPPVFSPWPPPGMPPPPVAWGEGEKKRWEEIRGRIAASPFHRALRGTTLVGTELPLLSCAGGRSLEERADLVVRSPRPARAEGAIPAAGSAGEEEYWVVDYKTGRREAALEADYARQVRGYAEILSAAWSVPARGFVWYVESGEAVEVSTSGT